MATTLLVGESLVGEGNEVAHVDLLIGSKGGPVGEAFANALVNQKEVTRTSSRWWRPTSPRSRTRSCPTRSRSRAPSRRCRCSGLPRRPWPAPSSTRSARASSARATSTTSASSPACSSTGSHGRQEDLRLQLPGHEGGDRARPRQRAQRERDPRFVGGGAPPVRWGRGAGRPRRPSTEPAGPGRLDGLHAVVTGASSGSGAPSPRRMPPRAPWCCSRAATPPSAREVADAIAARGGRSSAGRSRDARRLRAPRRRGARPARPPRRLGQQRRRGRAHRRGGGMGVGAQARRLLAVDLKGTIACSYTVGE